MRAFFGPPTSSVWQCQPFTLVVLLLLSPYISADEAVRYRHYCGLEGSPIVTLELRDGGYFLPGAEAVLFGATPTTTVSTEDDDKMPATIQARKCSCWHPRLFEGNNETQHLNDDFYCPAEVTHCGIPVTGGYQHDIHPPGCVSVGDEAKFARSIWPMLVISYAFLATFLLCSRPGRNVLGCCFSFCFPKWNLWTTKRIIETQPSMANGIILRALRDEQETRRRNEEAAAPENADTQQQQPSSPWSLWGRRLRGTTSEYVLELGPDEWALLVRDPATAAVVEAMNNRNNNNDNDEPAEPAPTALKLKTRVYHCGDYDLVAENEGPGHDDENEDPERGIQLSQLGSSTSGSPYQEEEKIDEDEKRHRHSCTICYGPIEEGDRVGALPTCDHIFHVDCLKSWLARRNVCPLCLSEDIAAPQYESAESATTDADRNATENGTPPADEGNSIERTGRDNSAP